MFSHKVENRKLNVNNKKSSFDTSDINTDDRPLRPPRRIRVLSRRSNLVGMLIATSAFADEQGPPPDPDFYRDHPGTALAFRRLRDLIGDVESGE